MCLIFRTEFGEKPDNPIQRCVMEPIPIVILTINGWVSECQLLYFLNFKQNLFEFLVAGASGDVCSDLFAGPHALSEPEARAMVDFTTSYPKPIDFYIAFHSAGQLLMFPWGYTDDKVENHDRFVSLFRNVILKDFQSLFQQMTIAEKTKEAIAVRYGTEYKVGPLSTTICEAILQDQSELYNSNLYYILFRSIVGQHY